MSKSVAVYVRSSTPIGLFHQSVIVGAFAASKSFDVILFTSEQSSAESFNADEVFESVKEAGLDTLVVADASRISRNEDRLNAALAKAKAAGVTVLFANEDDTVKAARDAAVEAQAAAEAQAEVDAKKRAQDRVDEELLAEARRRITQADIDAADAKARAEVEVVK